MGSISNGIAGLGVAINSWAEMAADRRVEIRYKASLVAAGLSN